jgi:hypothetical protein
VTGPISVIVNTQPVEVESPMGPDPISVDLGETTQVSAVLGPTTTIVVKPSVSPITAVKIAPSGPQGIPGPEGPAGAGGGSFVYSQGSPSSFWTIHHNLGKYPSVSVFDSANDSVEGLVAYVDVDTVTISFSAAFSGTAYIN